MSENIIETTKDALSMKYLTIVFESDVETVARVLAAMEDSTRDQLIDQVVTGDLQENYLNSARVIFNTQLEALNS